MTIEVLITDQGGTERVPRWAPAANKAIKCSTAQGHGFNRAGSKRVTVRYSPLVPVRVCFIQGRNSCSGRHGKPWLGIIYPGYAYHGPHDGVGSVFSDGIVPLVLPTPKRNKGTLDGHIHG